MVYLIGGPPRCGKSSLANVLLQKNKVPYLATDIVVNMLKNVAPELGVTPKKSFSENAEIFFPYLEQFVELARYDENNYCVEGCVIMPKQVTELSKKYKVRAVFLGFSKLKVEEIMKYMGSNKWMEGKSKKEQRNIKDSIIERSMTVKNECEKYGYRYFDMAEGFEKQLEKAYQYLVEN